MKYSCKECGQDLVDAGSYWSHMSGVHPEVLRKALAALAVLVSGPAAVQPSGVDSLDLAAADLCNGDQRGVSAGQLGDLLTSYPEPGPGVQKKAGTGQKSEDT